MMDITVFHCQRSPGCEHLDGAMIADQRVDRPPFCPDLGQDTHRYLPSR